MDQHDAFRSAVDRTTLEVLKYLPVVSRMAGPSGMLMKPFEHAAVAGT